ncbi:tryptophan halogenase [Nonomuraea polychroma]|uniref:Tryptophan halogenase n=1 Tax=Nonomuraea polychroma TaxID=46176 RepID=A0A438MEW4_9ACTN|nr:tryptophan halogenase family protein [Nonomuraea polychroma]RVX44158.1 tryptophan halogenase [Nonomuraea polychroma]
MEQWSGAMGPGGRTPLDELLETLTQQESAGVKAWLGSGPSWPGAPAGVSPKALTEHHEKVEGDRFRPSDDDPRAIRSVGVIGGGTAGYMTALALKTKRPWLDVTLVESKEIPIIGVGEATVSYMVMFMHHFLGIDPMELYRKVEPTWKLGIKFDWGPDPDGFMATFDWHHHSIGALGALEEDNTVNGFTVQSLMMMADRAAVYKIGDKNVSLMKYLPFAYHLDNARFVAFLTELAAERGVKHVEARLEDVVLNGEEWVDHVRTSDGRQLSYDFYVDCTGFRSMLLGKALGTGFHSYADTLFTDSAVTGNLEHGGHLKPYTTATTMNAGWTWNIPTPQSDHLGYVYASGALSDEEAAKELTEKFPGIEGLRQVRFRSGRHDKAWRGNVMAIGNSYAFVEPLESTGLLMIALAVQTLTSVLPASWEDQAVREVVNRGLGQRWDAIRWFLGIHYKFNTRLDTEFWKDVRDRCDVSGFQPLMELYQNGAPLTRRDPYILDLALGAAPTFFGLAGIDNILLGQKVPARLLKRAEPIEDWRARRKAADALVAKAMTQAEALHAFTTDPELNTQLLNDFDSWAGRHIAGYIGML